VPYKSKEVKRDYMREYMRLRRTGVYLKKNIEKRDDIKVDADGNLIYGD